MDQEAAGQIVDRLKAEGDLVRNTGTNSIRSVNIRLDKFEDIFNVISENIVAQTEMMMKSLDIQAGELQLAKESARREETAKQLEDLEEKQDQTELRDPEEREEKEEKEGKGLFAMLGGLGKLLMTGALIGGGLFVAYNFAKGFVDEMYNGAWTNFETGLVDFLTSIDFDALKNTFNNILSRSRSWFLERRC
jgi:NAD kinase